LEKVESECLQNLKRTIIENKQKFEMFKNHLDSSLDGALNIDKLISPSGTNGTLNKSINKKAGTGTSNKLISYKKPSRPGSAVTKR